MSKKISLSVFIFTLFLATLVAFMSAFFIVSQIYEKELKEAYLALEDDEGNEQGKYAELDIFEAIFKNFSYFNLDQEALTTAMLKSYVRATDDRYAEYYTADEYKLLISESAGEMQGIGINVIENGEYGVIEVINVMPDSPALDAGLQPGDLIVYVGLGEERESVAELGYYPSVLKLQGLVDTYAEFVVIRNDEEHEYSIKRGYITTQSVTYRISDLDNTTGVVKIINFDLTTPQQFTEAVDTLISQGISKFIFDVRYNPGGDLKSIEAVLSYFLNEGDVMISTRDRAGNEEIDKVRVTTLSGDYAGCSVTKEDIGKYRELNCVVIVNGSTASAAELFTANFRDYKIAPIVGVTTYGKGSMQSILPLEYYGFEGGIKLTTKMYFPPSGQSYEETGIAPDIEVDLDENAKKANIYKLADADDAQMIAALNELR